jgi:N-acetylmuramoyl-L-alanine amidase CwlA
VSNKKKKKMFRCAAAISGAAVFIVIFCALFSAFWSDKGETEKKQKELPEINIQKKLLKKNKYSRPGNTLKKVKGIVVHYTANPGTDAIDNRNYFNNLPKINRGKTKKTYASSHFVIGLEGQIVQCIPLNEIAYASNDRNSDTIAIECCHPDESGKFNDVTMSALKELLVYLCIRFELDEEDIIRHYDVTGKMCPLYFVEHEEEWNDLKEEIGHTLTD